ncbi:MAG: protein-L-isoaspartate(D-aspartate) O-methyltransferase [Thermodesulfobacteriota bacterium]|nr:protein-L-isoaspartate(D-aspartate) O-methyltransferase [Thermodesulfobacteriota bacterium]
MRSKLFVIISFIVVILSISCRDTSSHNHAKRKIPQVDFKHFRTVMVQSQIQTRGIKDQRVLDAMREVERHKFVPSHLRNLAYTDGPLPIGENQTISQPYIVALMTENLQLKGSEKVLEIGTGSGYQTAILAELAQEVYTIEIIEQLAKSAKSLLRKLGYTTVKVKIGDGYLGWKEYAPYDAIIVTCAPPFIPQPLIEQLAEDGRMVIPVGSHYQLLKKIIKKDGKIKSTDLIPVRFVPMTGNHMKKGYERGG